MNYTTATNDQLWTILRSDSDCPLSLMGEVFREAVNRGMIQQYILSIMKKKRMVSDKIRSILDMTHEDLIQLGYEGALKALQEFQPGKGNFSTLMYLTISQAYGKQFQYVASEKRQKEEVSYDANFLDLYLMDKKMNVEKTVITKLQLEEKLSILSPIQRETFLRFFIGYNYQEISELMNTKKSTVAHRMNESFKKMTGEKVNVTKLGLFERSSYKIQGA